MIYLKRKSTFLTLWSKSSENERTLEEKKVRQKCSTSSLYTLATYFDFEKEFNFI